ncbi:hypothetical protein CTI12_AA420920 [Artemisia annua]|uniref:Reverse transcriptase zinc-binding domain-containing protein n=1 Tax=Artemisia annua TaxID=35608 RepID=A0A2U1M4L7_ARTAN|nr:hypothetical protein CTI12_AA420920 [Artemisia annua]
MVLLAKWWSKLNSNKFSLWKVVLCNSQRSNFPKRLMGDVSLIQTSKVSQVWRDILSLQRSDSISEVLGPQNWAWKCGNGQLIEFCGDVWIEDFTLRNKFPELYLISNNRFGKINPVSSREDIVVWKPGEDGRISVKEVLNSRGITPSGQQVNCIWCNDATESVHHLLLHCGWSFRIWSALFRWWNVEWIIPSSLAQFSEDWNQGMGINAKKFWCLIGQCTIWVMWLARNEAIFKEKFTCLASIIRNMKMKVFLWASTYGMCYAHDFHIWESQPWALL